MEGWQQFIPSINVNEMGYFFFFFDVLLSPRYMEYGKELRTVHNISWMGKRERERDRVQENNYFKIGNGLRFNYISHNSPHKYNGPTSTHRVTQLWFWKSISNPFKSPIHLKTKRKLNCTLPEINKTGLGEEALQVCNASDQTPISPFFKCLV